MKRYKWDFLLMFILIFIFLSFLITWLVISLNNRKDVVINYNGNEIIRANLDNDNRYEINGAISKMIIVVENNTVDVIYSECDGQDCVLHNKISQVGDVIACIPNKVIITIEVAK